MHKTTIMIAGLGDLGGWVLELLARYPRIGRIVSLDMNEDWGIRKTNSAIIGAMHAGLFPEIEFVKGDLNDIESTAEVIKKYSPGIIYNSATLQSWWVITQLPPDAYKTIDEGRYGPWLPMHFVLAHKLMLAVKESGINTHVVNAAFPDAVNPVLDKLGLAPTVGVGNVDNVVPALSIVVSKHLGVPLRDVRIYLFVPHFSSYYMPRFGDDGGAPYLMKITVGDEDVTDRLDRKSIVSDLLTLGKKPGGLAAHPVVASSVVKIILGILYDTNEIGHAPGPNGLPGGYPIRLNAQGVEVVLPKDITLEEAIRVNEQGQVYDGIEEIQEDGTVVLTDKSANIFKDLLGYDGKMIKVSDMEAKAEELDRKFKEWAKKVS